MNLTAKNYEVKNSFGHNLFLAYFIETAELGVRHRYRGTSNTPTLLEHGPNVSESLGGSYRSNLSQVEVSQLPF